MNGQVTHRALGSRFIKKQLRHHTLVGRNRGLFSKDRHKDPHTHRSADTQTQIQTVVPVEVPPLVKIKCYLSFSAMIPCKIDNNL